MSSVNFHGSLFELHEQSSSNLPPSTTPSLSLSLSLSSLSLSLSLSLSRARISQSYAHYPLNMHY